MTSNKAPIEVIKAARLAAAYGQDWNSLSQEKRRQYLDCVEAIASAAGEPRRD